MLPHTGDATEHFFNISNGKRKRWHFGNASSVAQSTVNSKGWCCSIVPYSIAQSQVTSLVSDLAGKAPSSGSANYIQNQNALTQNANMWMVR
jgi:hypothetical protein